MAYNDRQWSRVLGFLNAEAEKAPPDGIGKTIETAEEFEQMLRQTEAIKDTIVSSDVNEKREFEKLERDKAATDAASVDLQDQIDKHPGNPNPPRPTPVTP